MSTPSWPWSMQTKEALPRGQSQKVCRTVGMGGPPEEETLPPRLQDEPVKEFSVKEWVFSTPMHYIRWLGEQITWLHPDLMERTECLQEILDFELDTVNGREVQGLRSFSLRKREVCSIVEKRVCTVIWVAKQKHCGCNAVYSFSISALTTCYQISGLKQHFISLQFYRSEVNMVLIGLGLRYWLGCIPFFKV